MASSCSHLFELERKKTCNFTVRQMVGSTHSNSNSRPRPIAGEDESTWRSWEPVNGPFEFRIVFLLMCSRTIVFFLFASPLDGMMHKFCVI